MTPPRGLNGATGPEAAESFPQPAEVSWYPEKWYPEAAECPTESGSAPVQPA